MEKCGGTMPGGVFKMGVIQDMVCNLCVVIVAVLLFVPHASTAQLCTRSVKVEEGKGTQRVPMIRRIPAQCSNWDRKWVWLTRMDCGTKYVTRYEDFPSRFPTYRLEYVCCPDDPECLPKGSSVRESEERFLAITFGTATAVLALLGLIFFISFCHKRRQSLLIWKRNQELYETTNGMDAVGCNGDGARENDYVDDNLKLMGESEYEEICDMPPDYVTAMEKSVIIVSDDNIAQTETKFQPGDDSLPNSDPLIRIKDEDQNRSEDSHISSPENSSRQNADNSIFALQGRCDKVSNDSDVLHLAEFNPTCNSETGVDDEMAAFCDIDSGVQKLNPAIESDTLVNNGDETTKELKLMKSDDSENHGSQNCYADFSKLCKTENGDGVTYENTDDSHSYEHLDPSTREFPSQNPTYEALILSETCPNDVSNNTS